MVYVIDKNGNALMPTSRHGMIRRLLKEKQAKVIKRCPFVIQLLKETGDVTQPITLGIDTGYKTIGISATTSSKELYSAEIMLRTNIVKLISIRREHRRSRRARKTRYRKAKYLNRKIEKGWIAPSIKQKIQTHITAIDNIYKILPITKLIIETASFDIQKIINPDIQNKEYQNGPQNNFWNVREYVLFRDNHICQICFGKSKDNILNVHHIQSRQTGGDAPNNLITLCETCHKNLHKNIIQLPTKFKRGKSYKEATTMGIMKWFLFDALKEKYQNVFMTYGYITKFNRINANLPKTHFVDARCITGNALATPLGVYYYQIKTRCHNRQIHKCKIEKGGQRKLAQTPYLVNKYRLFDKVIYKNTECFIFGRRARGFFDIRKLDGKIFVQSASYKYLTLIEKSKKFITERRCQNEQSVIRMVF